MCNSLSKNGRENIVSSVIDIEQRIVSLSIQKKWYPYVFFIVPEIWESINIKDIFQRRYS